MIKIIIAIIWLAGSLFLWAITYFFNGIWKENKIVWVTWAKIFGWPIYFIYRIFGGKK